MNQVKKQIEKRDNMKTAEINGIKISYNVEPLIKSVKGMEWNDEDYTARGECGGVNDEGIREGYCVSKSEFESCKDSAIKFLESLESELEAGNVSGLKVNQNGKLSARGRMILHDMGNVNGYYDYYGSHHYYTTGLVWHRTGDHSVELGIDSYVKHQDSF